MLKFGSILVPVSATIFLTVVIFLLIILIVALMVLNKVLCFANCKSPSLYFVDSPEKLLTDSESDDSDEDIFVNYAQIERTAEMDKLRASKRSNFERDQRRTSTRSAVDKHDLSISSDVGSETSKDIHEDLDDDTLDESKMGNIEEKILHKHNKAAILKTRIFLDTLSSKLKIQVIQVYDLIGTENRAQSKRKGSIGKNIVELSYQIHCTILPVKKHIFKTKVKRGSDPLFNETFYVPNVTTENVESLSIRFRIYASQTSSFNVIGQCTFEMHTADYTVDTEYNLSMDVPKDDDLISQDVISVTGSDIESRGSVDYCPEIMIGLALNSNTGRLTVEIIRGTTLSKDKNKDFYVKLSLFSASGQELSHTKTSVRKNTTSPVFRESFMFQVALFQMKEVTLMISVFAKKSIHRKEIIGWISLGYKSSGEEEMSHWKEVEEGLKTEVIRSHRLHQNSSSKKFLN